MKNTWTVKSKNAKDKVCGLMLTFNFLLLTCLAVFGQSGGQFAIQKTVIANGGEVMSGGQFGVTTTAGQPVAGIDSSTTPFGARSGFWQSNLVPTAANVSISGRVTTASGNGIRNARILLTSPGGTQRAAVTSTFGYYTFDGIEVGRTYVLEIVSRRYTFANPTRIFMLHDSIMDMDFVSRP